MKRKVAFVGDPDIRIKEDFLRIMRYFRFYGRISEKPDNHDRHTLDVIKQNAEGLQGVSGERIWMELKKTLQGNFAGDLLKTMLKQDIGKYIGDITKVMNYDYAINFPYIKSAIYFQVYRNRIWKNLRVY